MSKHSRGARTETNSCSLGANMGPRVAFAAAALTAWALHVASTRAQAPIARDQVVAALNARHHASSVGFLSQCEATLRRGDVAGFQRCRDDYFCNYRSLSPDFDLGCAYLSTFAQTVVAERAAAAREEQARRAQAEAEQRARQAEVARVEQARLEAERQAREAADAERSAEAQTSTSQATTSAATTTTPAPTPLPAALAGAYHVEITPQYRNECPSLRLPEMQSVTIDPAARTLTLPNGGTYQVTLGESGGWITATANRDPAFVQTWTLSATIDGLSGQLVIDAVEIGCRNVYATRLVREDGNLLPPFHGGAVPLSNPRSVINDPMLQAVAGDCTGGDEFERRRCSANRARIRAFYAAGGIVRANGNVTLGEYDFNTRRFPVKVIGLVGAEEWGTTGGQDHLDWPIAIAPPSRLSVAENQFPAEWLLAETYIQFDSDAAAETFRDRIRMGMAHLTVQLYFRPTRIVEATVPSALRHVIPRTVHTIVIEPMGWALLTDGHVVSTSETTRSRVAISRSDVVARDIAIQGLPGPSEPIRPDSVDLVRLVGHSEWRDSWRLMREEEPHWVEASRRTGEVVAGCAGETRYVAVDVDIATGALVAVVVNGDDTARACVLAGLVRTGWPTVRPGHYTDWRQDEIATFDRGVRQGTRVRAIVWMSRHPW